MNVKRLVCISLIISILFNTLICPISFAAYTFGPEVNSWSVGNWQRITTQVDGGTGLFSALQTVPIQVTESGIYCVSNVFSGNISSNFIISAEIPTADAGTVRVPLPIATYGADGEATMDISTYSNASQKKAGVYLEAGTTYYISFISEEGRSISKDNLTEGNGCKIYANYIKPGANDSIYETSTSSADYTASGITVNGTVQYHGNYFTDHFTGSSWTSDYGKLYQSKYGLYMSQELISVDAIKHELNSGLSDTENVEGAAWYEKILTWLVLLIGDGIRSAIAWAMGDASISIDDILFNNYSNTRLAIFSSSRVGDNDNGYLSESGMLDYVDENGVVQEGVLTKYFTLFRNIAIAVYVIILLYMGVNVLLHSTSKKKEQYKSKMVAWAKGVLILAMFTYVMKYVIVVNDAIVEYVEELKFKIDLPIDLPTMTGVSDVQGAAMNIVNSGTSGNGDIMETMRVTASKTGRVAYALIYIFLLKELIGFIYMYFKRLISVIFLIVIFPLVAISYAVDKVGDGKSQAFDSWFKEFTLDVFMQSFQAVNYVVIMCIIFALNVSATSVNVILMLIGLEYISKGDELLRGMFTKMSGGGANSVPRNIREAAKTILTMKVAKKAVQSVTSLGNRFTNVAHKASDVRDAYNAHIEKKYEERIRRNEELDVMLQTSMLNPEWAATTNVVGNMNMLLADPGTTSEEDLKLAADRLLVAKNDPKLRAEYNAAYMALSENDQKQLDELLQRNNAINETVNGNVGIKGPLTNLEININSGIILEIISNGKKVEAYRAGRFTGPISKKEERDYELYKYMQSKHVRNTRDAAGNEMTLDKYLESKASERKLETDELDKIAQLQRFSGKVTGLDTTTATGTNRVTKTRHAPLERMEVSARERQRKNALLNQVGTTGILDEVRKKREEAAKLVSRIKEYSEATANGTSDGCSATEMMELAKKWRELSQENDAGVSQILGKLADSAETNLAIKSDVVFNLEQFETMASLAVINDKEHLEGDEAQQQRLYDEAVQKIVEVSTGVKRDGTATGTQYQVDPLARNMVNRAELDDMIEIFGNSMRIDTRNYVRTGGTQEAKRDARVIHEQREMLEGEYDRLQTTSSSTRADLFRSSLELSGATMSAALAPLNIESGVTSTALLSGSTSDHIEPANLVSNYVIGSSLQNATESVIPGSQAAARSSTVGARLSSAVGNSHSTASDARVNEQLAARNEANNSARRNIKQFRDRLS